MENGFKSGTANRQRGTKARGGQWSGGLGRVSGDDLRIAAWPAPDRNSLGGGPVRYMNHNISLGTGRYSSAFFPDDRGYLANVLSGSWMSGNGVPIAAGGMNIGGSVYYSEAMTSGASGYSVGTSFSNLPGKAMSFCGFTGFQDNMLVVADGAACTYSVGGASGHVSYNANTSFTVANAGTLALTNHIDFNGSANVLAAGVTCTNRIAFNAQESASGGGVITNQFGFASAFLTGGTNNYAMSAWDGSTTTITTAPSGSAVTVGRSSTLTLNVSNGVMPGGYVYYPTIILQQSASSFGLDTGYAQSANYANLSSVAASFGPVNSFIANYTKTADTQTGLNLRTDTVFGASPTYTRALEGGGGTGTFTAAVYVGMKSNLTVNGTGCTVTSATDFQSQLTVTAGTVTTRVGLSIAAATTGGTTVNQYGIDIAAMTAATTTNVGIRCTPAIVLPPTTCTVSANAGTVPVSCSNAKLTNSSAATITVTMAVTNAQDGQITDVRIYDSSAASQTLTWVNTENGKSTASTTTLGSTTIPTHNRFMFNSTSSKWTCIGL